MYLSDISIERPAESKKTILKKVAKLSRITDPLKLDMLAPQPEPTSTAVAAIPIKLMFPSRDLLPPGENTVISRSTMASEERNISGKMGVILIAGIEIMSI